MTGERAAAWFWTGMVVAIVSSWLGQMRPLDWLHDRWRVFASDVGEPYAHPMPALPYLLAMPPSPADHSTQFASTTSAQLAGVLSDETGTGAGLFPYVAPTIAEMFGAEPDHNAQLTGTLDPFCDPDGPCTPRPMDAPTPVGMLVMDGRTLRSRCETLSRSDIAAGKFATCVWP